jgi:hypothetical protein
VRACEEKMVVKKRWEEKDGWNEENPVFFD